MTVQSKNMEFFNGFFEEKFSQLPKKQQKEAAADILTKSDAKTLFLTFSKELIEMVVNLKDEIAEKDKVRDEEVLFLRNQVVNLRLDLEKSQQYNNRDSFKICGIKEPTNLRPNETENTNDTVTKFFETASVDLPVQELSMTHRVPTRDTTKSKALLVKLRSRIVRNKLIRMKKDFRENELLKREYPDAFIVEHLTPLRAKVCYQLRQDVTIAKCWTIDGRIKVVKKDAQANEKPITIDSLAQLTKLGWTKKDVEKLIFEA